MTTMTPLELAREPGSYRWYYLDVSSGEWTAVAIFMLGSLFSSRYSRRHDRGALPIAHSAVNFALYKAGRRVAWVLSEYPHAELKGNTLHIGPSTLERAKDGRTIARIIERTPWWPTPVHADLVIEPNGPTTNSITLVDGLSHQWHPFAVRARGDVHVPSHGIRFDGEGYHDGNSGSRVLGTDLSGWSWIRTHRVDASSVVYRPNGPKALGPTAMGREPTWQVRVDAQHASVTRSELPSEDSTRTRWGLSIPSSLGLDAPCTLLESSPFYARLEARTADAHALGESGDFARFHSPFVRWMADFRTRTHRMGTQS
ncbi:MAG: carotenoid 1,2-hydratase [Archangium sp.]|nr:carotenoid 1,2-hydratase [Archangium sp.]